MAEKINEYRKQLEEEIKFVEGRKWKKRLGLIVFVFLVVIGGIVLLMYVIGGFFMLVSGGNNERVKKGKQYMTISTIGLIIVMFSYLGIYALRGVLQYGSVALTDAKNEYVACSGPTVEGTSCDLNSTCTNGGYTCESVCRQNHPDSTKTTSGNLTIIRGYDCVDTDTQASSSSEGNPFYNPSTCQKKLCPGDDSVQCCQIEYSYVE